MRRYCNEFACREKPVHCGRCQAHSQQYGQVKECTLDEARVWVNTIIQNFDVLTLLCLVHEHFAKKIDKAIWPEASINICRYIRYATMMIIRKVGASDLCISQELCRKMNNVHTTQHSND